MQGDFEYGELHARVLELEAVKVYRQIHNVDPVSARQAVEAIQARMGL